MNIEFSIREREFIERTKGDYSPARAVRQLVRRAMKQEQQSQQGANDETNKR